MKYTTYYLNNHGFRWVIRNKDNQNIRVQLLDYSNIVRSARYFYSFGNFAGVVCSVGGKLIRTLNYKILGLD